LARLILDTTVLVDAERSVGEMLERLIGDEDDVAVAAISVAELSVGVELAKGARRPKRAAFLTELLGVVSVESYDLDVAMAHAALLVETRKGGRPRGAHDLIIAATARARRREVVSADAEGFAGLGEVVLRVPGEIG
jgi:tRNA(fMet)-specific endonuclease VapC